MAGDIQPPHKRPKLSDPSSKGHNDSLARLSSHEGGSTTQPSTGTGITDGLPVQTGNAIEGAPTQGAISACISAWTKAVADLVAAKVHEDAAIKRYSERKKEHDKAQSLFKEYRATAENRRSSITLAKQTLDTTSAKVKNEERKVQYAEAALRNMIASTSYQAPCSCSSELEKFAEELERKDKEISELKNTVTVLMAKQEASDVLLSSLQSQSRPAIVKDDVDNAIREHYKQNCTPKQEVVDLRKNVDAISKQSSAHANASQKCKSMIESLERQLHETKEQLGQCTERLEQFDTRLNDLERSLRSFERETRGRLAEVTKGLTGLDMPDKDGTKEHLVQLDDVLNGFEGNLKDRFEDVNNRLCHALEDIKQLRAAELDYRTIQKKLSTAKDKGEGAQKPALMEVEGTEESGRKTSLDERDSALLQRMSAKFDQNKIILREELGQQLRNIVDRLNTICPQVAAVQAALQILQSRWDRIDTGSLAQSMTEILVPALKREIDQVQGATARISQLEGDINRLRLAFDRHKP